MSEAAAYKGVDQAGVERGCEVTLMSKEPQPKNTPGNRPPVRQVIAAIPLGTEYQASRYDTDNEMVLSLWKDGQTWDIYIPKPFVRPFEEQVCRRCDHSRKFHEPACLCGCLTFEPENVEDRSSDG